MTDPSRTSPSYGPAGIAGLVLVRLIVPLWITVGAATKLVERTPKLLPEHLRKLLDGAGWDLYAALSIFITIEFAAVAIMLFIPRLAKSCAIVMLSTFCGVLLYEIFNGNLTNCGCLGSYSPPAWLMLSIDLTLLILTIGLPVRPVRVASNRIAWALATITTVALGLTTFIRVGAVSGDVGGPTEVESTDAPAQTIDPITTETPGRTLPGYYSLDTSDWPGRRVRDIDLISWVTALPDSLEDGRQYLIFYSRTCEHCHDLLLEYFSYDPPAPTTIVAIPEMKEGFIEDGQLENPCVDCAEVELPVGVDWLMTPPVVVAIEDGVVQCAQEAEDFIDPACLPWHGF
ncbi:MAG: hypothetical protein QF733_01865 [Phycisphaerales bacterium]|nr:hypothetical protein [Phycisphaerales bacterium]